MESDEKVAPQKIDRPVPIKPNSRTLTFLITVGAMRLPL